ncbi:MAG: peroxidase-related enzyme [Rubrivivax sp.]|nr:peroxidase-related enzyme [Rubrivivax sp.]
MSADPDAVDVIDAAAGLVPGTPLFAARRFRATAIAGTQASHDALLHEPVAGLGTADRLRVAVHCCEATGAVELAAHYRAQLRLGTEPRGAALQAMPPATRDAMLQWAGVLTTDPRQGDRTALRALVQALAASGLGEGATNAAVVALAQLVAFLSYQTRVVAGLKAMALPGGSRREQRVAPSGGAGAVTPATPPVIRINGFTNETLQWRSWLAPVDVAQASPLQLQVLDESHAQARTSEYYLTLIHQPLMLRHRSAAYNAIMYAQGGLPRAERELGAMVVSVTNGCVYCTSVHAQRYAQLARRHDTVAQVFTDPSTAGSSERERAIARFAQAVTLRPQALGAGDIEPLRALGMSDEEVIDLLHAVAIFGWANRLMHNLGEPVDPDAA